MNAVRSSNSAKPSGPWESAEQEFLATGDAEKALSALTEARDSIALEAWQTAVESGVRQSVVMLATGAYARGESFPHTGLHIVLLPDTAQHSEALKSLLPEFVRVLWNAGLRVNCSALTIEECLEAVRHGSPLGIELLTRRYLAGNITLRQELESRLPAAISDSRRKITQQLLDAARTRHSRFENSPYHAEPDLRDAPGALQDIRLIEWLAILNPDAEVSAHKLGEARHLIASARCFAHYHAGSNYNILDFELQESLPRQAFSEGQPPAQWMRRYFECARSVHNEARRAIDAAEKGHDSLFDSLREYRARLSNQEFTVSHDHLLLRNPSRLSREPGLVLEAIGFVARHGVAPAPETERRFEVARNSFGAYCAECHLQWDALKPVLAGPEAGKALRVMDATGLLSAMLPDWGVVQHLANQDAERRYTMGELTLRSVERFTALRVPQGGERRFAELAAQVDDPALLVCAILFMEMGRDGGDPLGLAVQRARAAMIRMRAPEKDRATIEFLIEHQADLAGTSAGRDIDDPATGRVLAGRIGTVERLQFLALLSYVRLAAYSAEAKLPWRLDQLWRTYKAVLQELVRGLETDRIQQIPDELRASADFVKGFPRRYLNARSTAEIQADLRLFEMSRPTGVAVRLDPIENAWRVTVVGRDRPFLFASLAAAISSFGMDILKAEAFSNAGGVILDTFVFADPKRMLQLNPPEADRLTDMMRRIVLGKTDAQRLMRGRVPEAAKRAKPVSAVNFDSEACPTATLVEISTDDRPGLLYSLATVFSLSSCNIDVVMVDTKGRRAQDVFYVSHDGRKLPEEMQAQLKERLLAAC